MARKRAPTPKGSRRRKYDLRRYQEHLVINFSVNCKLSLDLDLARVNRLFGEAGKRYPGMTESKYPPQDRSESRNEGFVLAEHDPSNPEEDIRRISLRDRKLAFSTSHPLAVDEQVSCIRALVSCTDSAEFVVPWAIDYADFKFVFEINCADNHHATILKMFFRESCFNEIQTDIGGPPTDFSPHILIRHPADPSMRFYVEPRPRTTLREIESREYDGDHIAVICSAVKVKDFGHKQKLADVCSLLEAECRKLLLTPCLRTMVAPLLTAERE